MLDVWLLLKGIGIGILFSAPIGPVNIMCIQLAFRHGFLPGLAAGLGAVAADGLFAAFAAYGLTAVSEFIQGWASTVQLVGGLLLIAFGWRIFRTHPRWEKGSPKPRGMAGSALTAFVMTATNPATILGFVAVFGSLGTFAPEAGDYLGATSLVVGVLVGGSAWWIFISGMIALVRGRMTDRALETINRAAGALLVLFGVAILGRLAWMAAA